MKSKIAERKKERLCSLTVFAAVTLLFYSQVHAASPDNNSSLTPGTTTQLTPTKRTLKKTTANKTSSKTLSKNNVLSQLVPIARVDNRNRWDKKWGPLVPHKTFPKKCDICHIPKRWDVIRPDFHFDHLKETGFALEGAHAKAVCLRCHNDRMAAKVLISRSCSACHQDPHKGTLGLDCKKCHGEVNWTPVETALGQHARTRFPLTGLHVTVQCIQCHARAEAKDFSGASVDCYSCHQADYTKAPNHVAMNFAHTCGDCHTTTTFTGALFDHSKLGPNPTCYTCHQADYQSANNPPHAGILPTTCQQCHVTTTWLLGSGGTFDHASTGFALTGAHAAATCVECHINNNYAIPNANCVPCHNTDFGTGSYLNATTPVTHTAALFPPGSCQTCHGDFQSWANAASAFNHSITGFALTGKHAAACATCHDVVPYTNNGGQINAANCVPCHNTDFGTGSYLTASAPGASPVQHDPTNYPTSSCASCHGDFTAWTNGTAFNHAAIGFPLTGAHNTACANCHSLAGVTLSGNTLTVTCLSCHQSIDTGHGSYNSTSPSHSAMGWPATAAACQQCHSDLTSWSNGVANAAPLHASFTGGFVLAGLHNDSGKTNAGGVIASCDGCHANSNANISGTNCVPCHNADYATASAPGATPVQHDPINYPTSSCASCHGDATAWTNGTAFNHAAIGFPLTGAHNTACSNCHNLAGVTLSGNTLTVTCLSCHQSIDTGHGSYNSTSPSHSAMGWPATAAACQQCHGDLTSWTNGPTNAAPLHASFLGGFSLGGLHNDSGKTNGGGVVASCDGCHANSNSFISGTSCTPCHQQDYANASLPTAIIVHDPINYPTSGCASCHGDYTSWLNGSAFNHTAAGFPLTGLHNTACANCHNATLGQSHTGHLCTMCHLSYDTGHGDYINATTPIDHDMKNGGTYALPQACDNCHSYASAWTTTIAPHPTGACGGGTGGTTPWNHGGATSCSDCHTTVTSMSVADGTFNCSLCHRGHHKGTPAGQCAGG